MKVTVFIENIKAFIRCGVFEEERKLGGQYEISLYVESEEFVDYQELYSLTMELTENTYTYMEDFAKELLFRITEKWNPDSVIIRVNKLSVPFKHSFERAGIEIRWVRDGKGKGNKM